MSATFEVGKKYETRSGQPARVYAIDGMKPHTVHGAILDRDGWDIVSWMQTGHYDSPDRPSEWDLTPTRENKA